MTNPVEHIRDELEGAGDVIRLAEGQLYTVKAQQAGKFAAEATKAMEECDTLEQLCGVCSNVVKAEKVIGLNVSRRVHQTALREAVRLVLAAMPGTFWAMVERFDPSRLGLTMTRSSGSSRARSTQSRSLMTGLSRVGAMQLSPLTSSSRSNQTPMMTGLPWPGSLSCLPVPRGTETIRTRSTRASPSRTPPG